jgi:hypothetical protein
MLLRLGEVGAVQLVASPKVPVELERAVRGKAPRALVTLAVLLDRIRFEVAPEPGREVLSACETLLDRPGDARILPAAVACDVDYYIPLNRQRFPENTVRCQAAPFLIGTPGDDLAWPRDRLSPS